MSAGSIERVAIIGVGIMGTALAAEWAAGGRAVTLYGRDEARTTIGRERATNPYLAEAAAEPKGRGL